MVLFLCDACAHSQAVDDKHIGKKATCPKCKRTGLVATSITVENNLGGSSIIQQRTAVMHIRKQSGGRVGLVGMSGRTDPAAKNSDHVEPPQLDREWIVIDDPAMPVRFQSSTGIWIGASKDYVCSKFDLLIKDSDLAAIEVRFVLFDIWWEFVTTLAADTIQDMKADSVCTIDKMLNWHCVSQAVAKTHYASVGYVSRVRLADGTLIKADCDAIVGELRQLSGAFAAEQLRSIAAVK